ncbi:MAG: hypothetical protein ACK4GN_09705 [Runella sp.]
MQKIIFVLVLWANIQYVFAQKLEGGTTQTAEEIIAKAVEARGGSQKLQNLKSVTMEGVVNIMGMDIPMKSIVIHKRGMRNDMEIMGAKITMAIDGDKGWIINPLQGGTSAVEMPAEQLQSASSQLDLTGGLLSYKENGLTPEYIGKETVDGTEAFKVKMTMKDGTVITNFFDTKTYYLIKTAGKVSAQGQTFDLENKLSNYKLVEGVAFPHTMEANNPQVGAMTTNFTKIEVNTPIDESIFVMPKN